MIGLDERVFCPECQKQGLKSRVTIGSGSRTLMYCPPFYDEEGRLHSHDSNISTQEFRCSNGHSWSEKSSGKCWCGWGSKNGV